MKNCDKYLPKYIVYLLLPILLLLMPTADVKGFISLIGSSDSSVVRH